MVQTVQRPKTTGYHQRQLGIEPFDDLSYVWLASGEKVVNFMILNQTR